MNKIIIPVGESSHLHVKLYDKQDEGIFIYKLKTGSTITFKLKNSAGTVVQNTVFTVTALTKSYEIEIDDDLPAGNYTYDLTVTEPGGTQYVIVSNGDLRIK